MSNLDALRSDLDGLFTRLRESGLREADLIDEADARADGDASWVPAMIDSRSVHDPDYCVFGRLPANSGAVLDVGANWGYSVGSLRAVGCTLPIISFEILTLYRACLEAVKTKLGGGYDYLMCGVGAGPDEVSIYIPTINGVALTALTSGVRAAFGEGTTRNVVGYVQTYMGGAENYDAKILHLSGRIDSIDELLRSTKMAAPKDRIAAIKIDIEGMEGAALAGAAETLQRHHPLLMIEGGNRAPDVREQLDRHGYVEAERNGDILIVAGGTTASVNGFFIYPDQFDAYRASGLLS